MKREEAIDRLYKYVKAKKILRRTESYEVKLMEEALKLLTDKEDGQGRKKMNREKEILSFHAVNRLLEKSVLWNSFDEFGIKDDYHDWHYAEDELYIIRDRITHGLHFVKATSPAKAWHAFNELAQITVFDPENGFE